MYRFAEDCSVHGFIFIFGHGYSKFTRIFWITMVLLSFSVFSFYLHEIHNKWFQSYEFVTVSRVLEKENFPFPALTICSPIFRRDAILNYSYKDYNPKYEPSPEECDIIVANLHWRNPEYFLKGLLKCSLKSDLKISETVKNNSMNIDEIFSKCIDERIREDLPQGSCTKKFTKVLTESGVCFTFNMQSFETIFNKDIIHEDFRYDSENKEIPSWTVEKGYENNSIKFPKRAQDEAFEYFNIQERNNSSIDFYFVSVHKPNEIPTKYSITDTFEDDQYYAYDILIESVRTNQELRRYSPDLRRCYFEGERKLLYFKTYTKALCDWECQSNWTFTHCGCVKFSMPRNESMRVCATLEEVKCYLDYSLEHLVESMIPCDCYKPCNDIIYKSSKARINGILLINT